MARIRNGILGGFSNKVGEVIGQNYAGVSTMRAMPKYVTNPRTPAQEAHRAKMALAGSFLSAFSRGFSFSDWNKTAVNNGFNGALRANFSCFVANPKEELDVDLLSLDMGTYVGVGLKSCELVSAYIEDETGCLDLDMTWDGSSSSDWVSGDDNVLLFVVVEHTKYQPGRNFEPLYCDVLPVQRNADSYYLSLPVGDTIAVGDYVYVSFGVVAACMAMTGHNPQKPSETIKIPAKNIVKSVGHNPQKPSETIKIPAKNVVRFSAGASLKKAAQKKS